MKNHRFPKSVEGFKSLKSTLLPIVLFLALVQCNENSDQLTSISGQAQGTTYHISYLSQQNINLKTEIDSLLEDIDSSLSTYLPFSIISRINKNDSGVVADKYFMDVFEKSLAISAKTDGLFDVTVAPVINAWGFGFTKKANVDSAMIDSILQFVGYKMVKIAGGKVIKAKPEIMLDFNAIAPGYSVDVLAAFLESKGVQKYLVELGGEVKARGKKNENDFWRIGIDKPDESPGEGRPLQAIIYLRDKALATSGNYRKFYIENGKKYAHIIDPRTGYPAQHTLLSATVIADDCMTADAYATAFMVMGLERSKEFLFENLELGLEAYFIYEENGAWKTYRSESLEKLIEPIN